LTRLSVLLSTGFGIGYTPFAPGTMASLASLPFGYLLLLSYGAPGVLLGGLLIFAVGIWASGAHARSIGHKDPSASVIDEIAGQLLAMLPIVPVGGFSDGLQIAAAFVLFRFFDIAKLWPISRLERFDGGVGIMADDIAAGLAAAALLFAARDWSWI
jgi:phosphatidylglycerophosphatase A